MTNVNTEKFAPLVTLHGDALGIDQESYIGGRGISGMGASSVAGFKGTRVRGYSGLNSPVFEGNDYKQNEFYHNTLFDDFLSATLRGDWNANKGSDGSTGNAINVAVGGTNRLTTGAGATHTMAVNGAQITSPLVFKVSNGGLRFETRIKVSAITSQNYVFGLVDASTLTAPFTISGTTITGNGTNGVAFVQDSAASGAAAGLNGASINAGGAVQSVNFGTGQLTTAYAIFRIDVDASGNASFYINGLLVGKIAAALATTSVVCAAVGTFSNITSGSQTVDIDYILAENVRV